MVWRSACLMFCDQHWYYVVSVKIKFPFVVVWVVLSKRVGG
jgi:hypothetical protein